MARWLGRLAAAVLLVVGLYLLAAWIGSSIPRNDGWREAGQGGVVVGVETNGVHTALVMPIVTPVKDWREDFPPADLTRSDRAYTHVSVSWGEREVFLDTPTWWDLSPRTVLRVLTRGGEGLSHVAYYVRPASSATLRPLRLSWTDYARLVASIERTLPRGRPFVRHAGYGDQDVFYETGGLYTAIHTCNQWTSDRLAEAGVRTGRWTPLASGVMKWVAPPGTASAFSRAISRPAAAR